MAVEWGPLTLVGLLLPALAAVVGRHRSRGDRRWAVWIVAACVVALVGGTVSWFAASPAAYGVIAAMGIGVVALVVGTSGFVKEPRPVLEPTVDLGLAAAALTTAALAGVGILQVARHEQIFGAELLGVFSGAATLALTLPGVWWLRREFLTRRYGTGLLSADEIAALTADLTSACDPRDLLIKAADMVTATSGVRQTRLVLDDMAAVDGWERWPLLVGDELVGTMLMLPSAQEGLEARQIRTCRQLLPTVALVARAVALAVDADYARHDVVHQRDLERARILADLHDDLGPALAGMSMRVRAVSATHQLSELDDLGKDLAACRADLRRIVSGLTPNALESGDLCSAIGDLVGSFGGSEVIVRLITEIPDGIQSQRAVVIYRAVAEGITNAIKHANPTCVLVGVERVGVTLHAWVSDDGVGGVSVSGVGLESLGSRASELGGSLTVGPAQPHGTRLELTIPETSQ